MMTMSITSVMEKSLNTIYLKNCILHFHLMSPGRSKIEHRSRSCSFNYSQPVLSPENLILFTLVVSSYQRAIGLPIYLLPSHGLQQIIVSFHRLFDYYNYIFMYFMRCLIFFIVLVTIALCQTHTFISCLLVRC